MSIAIGLLLIAVVFLIWKLNDILGTQQGHVQDFKPEASTPPGAESSKTEPEPSLLNDMPGASSPLSQEFVADGKDYDTLVGAIAEISAADAQFDAQGFLVGAKSAFDMIMTAFAEGDRDTLSSLVSKEIYTAFETAIRTREEEGHKLSFTIFEEPKVVYESAELDRGIAYVGVRIESLQTSVVTDQQDVAVKDAQTQPQKVTNHWVFSRQTSATDPNWTLIQTAA